MLGRHDEGRDALITAAVGAPAAALASWRAWRTRSGDTERDPIAQRWLPLIGANLATADLTADERTLLAAAQRRVWASNTRLLEAAREAAALLHDVGIQTILLKGAALALTVYDSHALRPLGDVDLLVRPAQAAAARQRLAASGWQPLRRIRDTELAWRHAIDLRRPPHGAVDLHWYLLADNPWPTADDGVWARVQALDGHPGQGVLAPADQLVHTCAHGLRWSPVHAAHWIADAARILESSAASIDWQVVVEESTRRSLAPQVGAALHILRAVAAAPVPAAVIDELNAVPATWRERLEAHAKVRPVVGLTGIVGTWCRWRRLGAAVGPSAPGWLQFLATTVGVDSRRALGPWAWRHGRSLLGQPFSGRRSDGRSCMPHLPPRTRS